MDIRPRTATIGEFIICATYHGLECTGSITAIEPIYSPVKKVRTIVTKMIIACFFSLSAR